MRDFSRDHTVPDPFVRGDVTLPRAMVDHLWLTCCFVGSKWHVVPAYLFGLLCTDLAGRGHSFDGENTATIARHEQVVSPGPLGGVFSGEHVRVEVSSHVLLVPKSRVATVLHDLARNPVRKFADGTAYRKLYGPVHCWVIPEDWRAEIIGALSYAREPAGLVASIGLNT